MTVIREAEVVVNVVDNVTPALDKIAAFLDRIGDAKIGIKLDTGPLEKLGNLAGDTQNATRGLKELEAGADKSTSAVDRISAAGQKMANVLQDTGKRGRGAFASMKDSVGELSRSLGDMSATLMGLAAGGAIAGMSWKAAVESGLAAEQVFEKFDRNKSFQLPGEKLETWSKGFENAGWTDEGDMRALADVVYTTGGKNVRGERGLEMTEQIARVQAGKVGGLGVSPEVFMRLLESKDRLPTDSKQRQLMAEALGTSQDDRRLNTRRGREELLKSYSESESIQKGISSQPWIAANNAVEDLQKSIGKTLVPAMTVLVGGTSRFLNLLADVPGVPWLIGMGAMAITAANGLRVLSIAVEPLGPLFGAAKATVLGHAAATTTNTAASLAAEAASKAEAVARAEETLATRMSTQAGVSDTAIASQNAIAKEARAAADLAAGRAATLNSIETSANTGSQAANTGVTNVSMASRLRLAAATMYESMATKLSTAATMLSTAGAWTAVAATTSLAGLHGVLTGSVSAGTVATTAFAAAEGVATVATIGLEAVLSVLLGPVALLATGGLLLAGALALVAAKSGIVGPLLKGIAKIDLGRIWKDLEKNDFEGAWKHLTKGFKLPSLAEMWGNLTEGLPDIGKLLKLPSGMGAMAMSMTLGIGDPVFTKLASGVELISNNTITVQSILLKIKDIWEGFVGWLQNGWKAITELADNLVDRLKLMLPASMGGYTDEEKAARAQGIEPGDVGWPGQMTEDERAASKSKYEAMTPAQKKAAAEVQPSGFVNWLNNVSGTGDTSTSSSSGSSSSSSPPTETKTQIESLLGEAKSAEVKRVGYEPSGIYVNEHGDTRFGYEVAGYPEKSQAKWHKKSEPSAKAPEEKKESGGDLVGGLLGAADRVLGTNFRGEDEGNESSESAKAPKEKEESGGGTETPKPAQNATKPSEPGDSSDKGILDKAGETLGKAGEAVGGAVNAAGGVAGGAINATGEALGKAGDALGKAGKKVVGDRLGFDVGATFTKGGAFQGKVHEKEEIIPQATAQRGAGPISRALGELQVAGSGGYSKRRAVTNIFEGSTYNINNPVVPDSGAAYHLTDTMKRELDPYIEERVKRMIGQYIT
jgi:hypothetical protein